MTSEDKIIEALKRNDDGTADTETLHRVVLDMTQNQSVFLRIYPWIAMFGALIVAIIVAVEFFGSEQPKQWILYATIFICDVIVMAIIKLWLYLCWVRNSIMREIKRAELRLLVGNEARLKSD